jgi:phosphoribosylformylglycinamidine cyclo-ligase
MNMTKPITYKDAGVDIDAAGDLEEGYTALIRKTFRPGSIDNPGGYGGLFRLGEAKKRLRDPVLVSGTDGVGTKLKIAFALDKHDTIGIDLVAMSANDVLVQGAEPLFFLDYIGTGGVDKRVLLEIVKGVAEGCRQAGCALLGGETAELPGFYQKGEYDLAGFCTGVVERGKILDGSGVKEGDALIGLASNGLHSNGYSLARKVLIESAGLLLDKPVSELGKTLGEELLVPTRIYAKSILSALSLFNKRTKAIHALAHITGGGLVENLPRVIPANLEAVIDPKTWTEPAIFGLIRKSGPVEEDEMRRVFNLGIGMVMAVSERAARKILAHMESVGETASIIGRMEKGKGVVRFI